MTSPSFLRPVQEQTSLLGEILDWMLAPLLLLWPMSLAITWLVAQNIANRPYDSELGAMTRVLAQEVMSEYAAGRDPRAATLRERVERSAVALMRGESDDRLYFQVLGPRGELIAGDDTLPVPAEDATAGELRLRDDAIRDEPVRVATLWLPLGAPGSERGAVVQMAETLAKRTQLANEIIKGVILPQFVILPLAVMLVWFALSRGIRPLELLQQRIRRRDSNDLSPIPEIEVPEEVAPLVRAVNDLLQRLDQSMVAQRHFLADAAHQLKTPLAGLRMQAEIAERQIDRGEGSDEAMKHTLQQIAWSSQRAARMVNQLLAMARTDDPGQSLQREPVDLAQLTIETVRDFVPRALEQRIDLGYEGPADGADAAGGSPAPRLHFMGYPVLVRELVRNLVDNALQYTPRGGTVTARITPDPFGQVVVLEVEDSGPGIPAAERELVFRPFYRTLGTQVDGSGLGLAIVSEIAAKHGAKVLLEDANNKAAPLGPGARFTVRFAVAQEA